MSAGDVTAERIAELRVLANHLCASGQLVGACLREVIDALEAYRAEVASLRRQLEERKSAPRPADLWAIHWSPGCWDLYEDRDEAESVARTGICELVPLWMHEPPGETDALRSRLEVSNKHPFDGIDTRDATIRILEDEISALRAEVASLRRQVEEARASSADVVTVKWKECERIALELNADPVNRIANSEDVMIPPPGFEVGAST